MLDSELVKIELLTKDYAECRKVLENRIVRHRSLMQAITRRLLPGIKSAVANANDAKAKLTNQIDAHRELFEKPKTQVFHGIKVGLKKGSGAVEFDDEALVIALIKREFPEQKEALIKVKETLRKKALAELTIEDLEKIGAVMEGTQEYVLIKDTVSNVDKLVAALLKEGKSEGEDD
jgi:hypothetical protein